MDAGADGTTYAEIEDIEALFRHALLFTLQTHCETCGRRESECTDKATMPRLFQNQSPSNDFVATPQIVYDTSWMQPPCQVTQVDGPDEQVIECGCT